MERYKRSGSFFSLSEVFYTQENIKGTFHDGSEVSVKNIKSAWKLRVTKAPNGQWFTLNNRMLFAHNMTKWAPDGGRYLIDKLLSMDKVEIVPFSEAKVEFFDKKTTKDNGNTCYIRGCEEKRDWICAEWVNREAYAEWVNREAITSEEELLKDQKEPSSLLFWTTLRKYFLNS